MFEIHNCPRCNYETDNIYIFKKHLNRKKICEPIKSNNDLSDIKKQYLTTVFPHICENCERGFTTKYGLTKHNKICTINRNSILTNDNKSNKDIEFENMKKEIAELRQLVLNNNGASTSMPAIQNNNEASTSMSAIQNIQNNIQQNTQNANTINNINININPITQENKDYITKEFVIECLNDKLDGLVKLFEKLHYDKDHPENNNIKIENDNLTILGTLENIQQGFLCVKKETVPYKEDKIWLYMKKIAGIKAFIIDNIENKFRDFIKMHNIPTEYVKPFLKDVGDSLSWTLYDEDEDDTPGKICACARFWQNETLIFKILKKHKILIIK